MGADGVYDALIETNAVIGALILAQPKRNLIPELEKRYDENLRALTAAEQVRKATPVPGAQYTQTMDRDELRRILYGKHPR